MHLTANDTDTMVVIRFMHLLSWIHTHTHTLIHKK